MKKLLVKNANQAERFVDIPDGAMSIGRAEDNDLAFIDKTVSSRHARIFTYLNACYIEDLGSTNGTFLNGKRIEKHTLRAGDVITVGKNQLQIAS